MQRKDANEVWIQEFVLDELLLARAWRQQSSSLVELIRVEAMARPCHPDAIGQTDSFDNSHCSMIPISTQVWVSCLLTRTSLWSLKAPAPFVDAPTDAQHGLFLRHLPVPRGSPRKRGVLRRLRHPGTSKIIHLQNHIQLP